MFLLLAPQPRFRTSQRRDSDLGKPQGQPWGCSGQTTALSADSGGSGPCACDSGHNMPEPSETNGLGAAADDMVVKFGCLWRELGQNRPKPRNPKNRVFRHWPVIPRPWCHTSHLLPVRKRLSGPLGVRTAQMGAETCWSGHRELLVEGPKIAFLPTFHPIFGPISLNSPVSRLKAPKVTKPPSKPI